ncbi:MAG: hypothetical protein JWM05_3662 [Acidimicrobiales bacterium]|nr:hypothetical protein [Acidimicrobiales bacterium]
MPAARPSHVPRRAFVAVLMTGLALLLFAGPAAARPVTPPRHVQTSPSSTAPLTTTESLLQGAPAASTTTAPPAVAKGAAAAKANRDNRRVWYVVGSLLGVAVLLAALTIFYWFRTRPSLVPIPVESRAPTSRPKAPRPAGRRPIHEPASRPVLDGDPLAPDNGRFWGDTPEPGPGPTRLRRPSVAGLDHTGSDGDYAPRGTGQLDRVEPTVVRRSARPSRPAREEAIRRSRDAPDR